MGMLHEYLDTPLHVRMVWASYVLEEANLTCGGMPPDAAWCAAELRREAAVLEAEVREGL